MSSQLFLVIAVVGGTFGFMFFMRRRLHTQYAHMRAGDVAARLGMRLVEGNPAHNLVTQSVLPSVQNTSSAKGFLHQMAATSVGGTLGEFKLHMVGQPYGAHAELVLFCREDYRPGLTENVTTTWSDLRLTIHARCAVAPFDLRLRKEMTGLEARRDGDAPRMPPQRFGIPALDERFLLECPDPRLPGALAAALAPLATDVVYVHITGAGNQVSFVMTPTAVSCAAMSLERILHTLASIVAVFEGRPMPAVVPAAA
ncbi:MAG: hypothetical protein KIT31_41460 [Deltaproteobacteria bacterium]|nr:hypothetical protein [Deltaproteobacteria bacterium]